MQLNQAAARRWLALVVALALVACGRDPESSGVTPGSSEVTSTETVPATIARTTAISRPSRRTSTAETPATTTRAATTSSSTTSPSATSIPSEDVLAGQRVLCAFDGGQVPDDVVGRVHRGQAAGVVLFKANVASVDQANGNANAVQAAASSSPMAMPAIVAVDQEGGQVKRLPGPPTVSARELGTMTPAAVREQAKATGENMRRWGVNTNLAPVADVARSGTFLDRQQRSFGSDATRVATDVDAFVGGLHDGGARAVAKHFPGLGAADANTDVGVATVAVDGATLRSVDLAPFRTAIAAGADGVMVSSAIYKDLTDRPAVLSADIVTGLLRGELGFTGVVVSDALDTPSLAPYGSLGEVAVQAAVAGVDLMIASRSSACGEIHDALVVALNDGRLDRTSAVEAYRRVIALRQATGG